MAADEPVRGAAPVTLSRMITAIATLRADWCATLALTPGDSVLLQVDSLNDGWIAGQSFGTLLRGKGVRVYLRQDSLPPARALSVRVLKLGVGYDDLSREGLFGAKSVRRTVSAEIAYRLTDRRTGELLVSGDAAGALADTVNLDDVPHLGSSGVPRTQAEAPQDTFLDKAVEPFLVIGAAGLAVYLLFHIRS